MHDIKEFMTTGTNICTHLTSIENILKLMTEKNVKEIFVVDTILEKHLVGTINENDILRKAEIMSVDAKSLTMEECMKPILIKAREDLSIEECDRILKDNKLDHIAIVDVDGHLCGVYTPESLLPIRQ